MNVNRRETIAALTSAAVAPVVTAGAFVPTAVAQPSPQLSPQEARALAQEAWVFGMPLVYIEKQIDVLTHVTKPRGAVRADQPVCALSRVSRRLEQVGRRPQCRYALLVGANSISRKVRWSCPFPRWAIASG